MATKNINLGCQVQYLPKTPFLAVPRPLDLPVFTVIVNAGRLEQLEMKTRRGQVRVFKKPETLWKLCRQLGTAEFEVRAR
ncbi:hypothetical protein [Sedimenticola selenatireducens]|uniref:hypothetical protein n=1 Tax=Sedimenticola selenatireducens TaxID=191960 RepID=UPI002353B393|nr:hypothetical protein [Sedimenticola selenatireducens]